MCTDYLDHLSDLLRCSCLSDLRCRAITHGEARMILDEQDEYPLLQYIEAARYILLDKAPPLTTIEAAKKAIVAHMS